MNPSDIDDSAAEWVAIPPAAIQLDPPLPATASDRYLAIAALRQELADRNLDLPFGSQIDPADPDRLLAVNHLAVQLVCTAMGAESVAVPLGACCLKANRPQATIFDLRRQRCARHLLLIVEPFRLMGSAIPPNLWVGGLLLIPLPLPPDPSGSGTGVVPVQWTGR
jgi:hypothetical protein